MKACVVCVRALEGRGGGVAKVESLENELLHFYFGNRFHKTFLAAAVDIIEAPGYRRWYVGILVHGGVAGPAGFWPPQPFCLLLTLYINKHQVVLQE